MADPIESFTEVHKCGYDCCWLLAVKLAKDEVYHLDQIMDNRAPRDTTKLGRVNMWIDVGPYPVYENHFKSLADELSQA